MNNIDTILYLIDWNRSEQEQQQGINMAREVKCIKAFFQPYVPGNCKRIWHNCAQIIIERSDEELIPYTDDLLIWISDLNVPGAELVLNRLLCFSNTDVLSAAICRIIPALIAIDDYPWLMSLADLLDNKNLIEKLDDTTISILSKYRLATQ